ncbi:MAG: phospho-N-acetylmuramoyl-pentapeptide-transferase [Desulfobacterales bacterium]|nr:phospho-N-acetylmuramoyl-pentapeptide-transferase [Desulfobacterales bacterium]
MLYYLLYPLHTTISAFNVFRYITFRAIYASLTAMLICLLLGPWVIRRLTEHQVHQYVRQDGPPTHLAKTGTPTMGGLLILFAVVTATLLWGDLANFFLWMVILVTISYGAIGFADDYLMQKKKQSKGLSGSSKFLIQAAIGILVGGLIYTRADFDTHLIVPFLKEINPDLGWAYILFAAFVIVGTSNAVNLTDGLDGLAIGPMTVAAATFVVLSYVSGHAKIADYLQIQYVGSSGELAVFCGAVVGAGMGFLWYNSYPAQIFMGDVGSLPLGGALGAVAVITKHEILLALVGGIFVIEALSVIFQVCFFKVSNGRRIFRMAPLHHHFELKGWPEPKVIVRFWIIAIILGLLSISTLKLR